MIFQPNEFRSGPNGSEGVPFRGHTEPTARYGLYRDDPSDSPLPVVGRISDRSIGESAPASYSDALTNSRILRLVIAGVQHRGESVLTDLSHEFPTLPFTPSPEQIAFRAALLEAIHPVANQHPSPHSLIRQERVHIALGSALSNLVARASKTPLHELTCDESGGAVVPPEREMHEYLASAWAVRSFIRVATDEPEMFRILVTEMATIQSNLGRFTLGVPMSPLLVYEFFNAAARNPELAPDVVRAFQIIGYRGEIGERLFREFTTQLEKQIAEAS